MIFIKNLTKNSLNNKKREIGTRNVISQLDYNIERRIMEELKKETIEKSHNCHYTFHKLEGETYE